MTIKDINDEHLEYTIDIAVLSLMDCLNEMPMSSNYFEFYLAGLAYGIWISLCNIQYISQEEIKMFILDRLKRRLN